MNLQTFRQSLQQPAPPAGISLYLQALWHDANGDWETAHHLIQDEPGDKAARIHAYLHRKEGDAANASYWYWRAGLRPEQGSLEKEWEAIAAVCIQQLK